MTEPMASPKSYVYDQLGNKPRGNLYYLKYDADKVIADLEESHKKEVEQLLMEIVGMKNEIEEQKRLRNMALASVPNVLKVMKIIQRHKYKRCMAMAERCKFRMYYLSTVVDYELSKLIPNPTAVKRYSKKESRMDYWKNRWLELADQFKEVK